MKNPDKMSERELRLTVKIWRAGLSKLSRPEAFVTARAIKVPEDDELVARMNYAEMLLEDAEL